MSQDDSSNENNKSKIRSLLVMAAADGAFTTDEVQMLALRAERWGLSDSEFAEALSYATSTDAQIFIPDSRPECLNLLRHLLEVMAADGKLTDSEKMLFARAAGKMDLPMEDIDKLIDTMLN
jgi:uncharacterized tellurite resistance protein B-like protein